MKKLKPPFTGFRLRSGDYRVFFDLKDENTITITAVRNRREAYPLTCASGRLERTRNYFPRSCWAALHCFTALFFSSMPGFSVF